MADRRLTYQIDFHANTQSLRKDLWGLVAELQSFDKAAGKNFLPMDSSEIRKVNADVKELARTLQNSINLDTGKIDLVAFSAQLKQTGKDLEYYRSQIQSLGPAGQSAFLKVTQAVAQADAPLARTNKLVSNIWMTLKNTTRWQLTSGFIRNIIGNIEMAYGYAKDLDSSLNKIQIVTKSSAEEMAKFAKEANVAAKALSTTTTEYTKAALIYYQQGLNDKQVKDRTDLTIKLSNVAGISAEEASQQLTAIWNNFYRGTESLERYIDVMTKLGATTASSSSEIAQGMQKFAAVADTVGLSYDYAASALATIVATTRESADIVGNSLKTLFSRIQSLQLGDTLEDGTTLAKYSQALDKVGINIKTTSGELKNMDTILDELGAKWQNLGKDQQIALAETIAGVRQYNQLIALMNNWDFFKQNVVTAQGADGELERQALIYADSWEAARQRVRAAAEDIYDSLINPDFYKDLDNIVTPFLTFIAKAIDGLGGMKGTLSAISTLMMTVFRDRMAEGMINLASSFGWKDSREQAQAELVRRQASMQESALLSQMGDIGDTSYISDYKNAIQEVIKLRGEAVSVSKNMTEADQKLLDLSFDRLSIIQQETEEYIRQYAEQHNAFQKARTEFADKTDDSWYNVGIKEARVEDAIKSIKEEVSSVEELITKYQEVQQRAAELQAKLTYMNEYRESHNGRYQFTEDEFAAFKEKISEASDIKLTRIVNSRVGGVFEQIKKSANEATAEVQKLEKAIASLSSDPSVMSRIEQYQNIIKGSLISDASAELRGTLPVNDYRIKRQRVEKVMDGAQYETALVRQAIEQLKVYMEQSGKDTTYDQLVAALEQAIRSNEENKQLVIDQITKIFTNPAASRNGNNEDAIQNLINSIKQTIQAEEELSNLLNNMGTDDPLYKLKKSISSADGLGDNYQQELLKMVSGTKDLTEALTSLEDKYFELNQKLTKQKFAYDWMQRNNFTNVTDQNRAGILNALKLSGIDKSELSNSELKQFLDDYTAKIEKLTAQISAFRQLLQDSGHYSENDLARLNGKAQELANTGNIIAEQTDRVEESVKNTREFMANGSVNDWAQNMLDVGRSLAAMSTVFNQLKNIGDVLLDSDSSFATKLTQLLSIVGMAIMTFNTLDSAASKIGKSLVAYQKAHNIQSGIGLSLKLQEIAANGVEIGQLKQMISLETIRNKLKEASPEKLAGLKTLGVIMAITAAVVAAVQMAKEINNAIHADEIALANASKASQNLQNNFTEAKNKYEELQTTMSNYESARDGLDTLAEGTADFTSKLLEANEKALELIKTLDLIQDKDYTIDNGRIILDNNSVERGLRENQQRVAKAQTAAILADNKARTLQLALDQKENRRLGFSPSDIPFGMVNAKFVNNDVINQLANLYGKNSALFADTKQLSDIVGASSAANEEYMSSLEDVVKQTYRLSNQMKASAEIAASAVMSVEKSYKGSSQQNRLNAIGGKILNQGYDEAYENYMRDLESAWYERKYYAHKYFEENEIEVQSINANPRNGVKYKDNSGAWQPLSNEEIAMYFAAADAEERLAQSTDFLVKKFEELESSVNAGDKAISDFLAGDLAQATFNEFDAWAGEDKDYLKTIYSVLGIDKRNNETVKKYGVNTVKEFRESVEEEVKATREAWSKLDIYHDLLIPAGDITLQGAKSIQDIYDKINYGALGEDGANKFLGNLNAILSQVKGKESKLFSELMAIDPGAVNAHVQLRQILQSYGVTLNDDTGSARDFLNTLRQVTDIASLYQSLEETLMKISNILSNLDFGSVISKENFETLAAYNEELRKYFILQSDGQYKFLGSDSASLKNEILQETEQARQYLQERIDLKKQYEEGNLKWYEDNGHGSEIKDWTSALSLDKGEDYQKQFLQNLIDADDDSPIGKILNKQGYSDTVLGKIIDNIGEDSEKAKKQLEELGAAIDEILNLNEEDENQDIDEGLISSYAKTLDELNQLMSQDSSLNNEDYVKGLLNIATQYESCAAAAEMFKAALASGTEEEIRAADDALELAIRLEEAQKQLDKDVDVSSWKNLAKYIRQAAKESDEFSDELAYNEKNLIKVTTALSRFSAGITNFKKDYTKLSAILNDDNARLEDKADAYEKLKEIYADVLDIDGSSLSTSFVNDKKNFKLLSSLQYDTDQAVKNYKELQKLANQDIRSRFDIQIVTDADGTSMNGFDAIDDIMTKFQSIDGLEAGATVSVSGGEETLTQLSNIINSFGAAKEAAIDYIKNLGVDLELEPVSSEQMATVAYNIRPKYDWKTAEGKLFGHPVGFAIPNISWDYEPVTAPISGGATAVKVKSASVAAGGGVKGGTASKYKGGGGGGSKIAKHTPTTEPKETDKERYHTINRQISNQERSLKRLSDASDRAYGTDRLKLYAQEIENLTKQQENYNKKVKEAQHYLNDVDKPGLTKALASLGLDINNYIDSATGEISGFEELQETIFQQKVDMWKKYEDFTAKYDLIKNPSKKQQEEKNALDEEKRIFEERISDYETWLANYEDSLDQIQENLDNALGAARQAWDKKFESITYKLQVEVSIKNMRQVARDLSKAISESYGDALTHTLDFGGRQGIASLGYDQIQDNIELFKKQKEEYTELVDLINHSTADEADMTAFRQGLESLQQAMAENAQSLLDWIDYVENAIPNALDAARERFDVFINQLEHNNSIVETIKELYALQGVTYKTMEGFNRLQKVSQEKLDASLASAKLNRKWYENSRAMAERAYADLQQYQETDVEYDFYKKRLQAYLEESNKAHEAMLANAQAAMSAAQEMYLDAIEKAAYDFGQAVSDGIGLDLLQDKYDHYIEKNERYFDKVNEAYKTVYWYDKLQTDIDNTANKAMKEKLKTLQTEIDLRREGNKLSEYDMNILEAKYKVLQAQIALEDAQNNKNQLKLVRDSQGNWNYQYTANEDDIVEKEKELLDAQNEWYNIAKEQVKEVTGEIVATWQECQEKIKEVYSDMTLTDEERANRAAEIYQYYTDKIKYLEEEKQVAIADMTEAGNEALVEMGKTHHDQVADLVDDFDNVFAKDLDNMTKNTENFGDIFKNTVDTMQNKFQDYGDLISDVAYETGTSLWELDGQIQEVSDDTDQLAWAAQNATDAMWEQINAIDAQILKYAELTEVLRQLLEMEKQVWEMANASFELPGASDTPDKEKKFDDIDYYSAIRSAVGMGLVSIGDEAYQELLQQRADAYEARHGEKFDWATNERMTQELMNTNWSTTGNLFNYQGPYSNNTRYFDSISLNEYLKKILDSYDTGGYTGVFQNEKLAFLHQKELVLNESDTRNIFAAVNAVRMLGPDLLANIEKTLDGNALAASALMAARVQNQFTLGEGAGTLEQKVTIEHVEFPNVTDSSEIVEAFNTIVNDAAQFAQIRKS